MKNPAVYPRPDQIAELTRSVRLPLPEISNTHLEFIAESLVQAFTDVRTKFPAIVASGSEAEVTALMQTRLNSMIEQDIFWGQLVLCVARGNESLSFDGSHLEKRPDLSIYISNRSRGFPLIVEAKIVDASTAKTEKLYCENGIQRFVEGEYAWSNREAFMIAYVRDKSSITSKLTPFLSSDLSKSPPIYSTEALPSAIVLGTSDVAISRHRRNFSYSGAMLSASKPGSISLWHIWLP